MCQVGAAQAVAAERQRLPGEDRASAAGSLIVVIGFKWTATLSNLLSRRTGQTRFSHIKNRGSVGAWSVERGAVHV